MRRAPEVLAHLTPLGLGCAAMLTLLACRDCVNSAILRKHLHDALEDLGWTPIFAIVDPATLPPTDARRAYPRPAVLWQGRDLFGMPEPPLPYPPPT